MEPEKIIELLKGRLEGESLDAYEICYISESRLAVEARNGEIESFSRVSENGVALRVVKDHKMGMASSTDLCCEALAKLVSSVVLNVEEVSPSEESVIPGPEKTRKVRTEPVLVEKEGRTLGEVSESQKMKMALKLEREAKAVDKRIARVRQPLYEETTRKVVILNSNGIFKSAERGIASCEVRAVAFENGESESGWAFSFSPRFDDLDCSTTAKMASERAVSLLGAKPIPTGRYNVMLETRPASQLLRLLLPSFFADNVQRGKSAIKDKKGKAVLSPLITIIDDGRLPDGFASFPFDDEGVTRHRTIIVKEGVITNWLYDTQRALKDGKTSTGNSHRASIHKVAAINVTNCFIAPSDTDPAKLLSSIQKGFLVTDVMGLHTANPVTGDFSLGAEGFSIEGGLKADPVRGVLISGNIHELLHRVAAVGSDLHFLANYGSPTMLIPDVWVSGAG
jgi:PmbA protein